MKVFLYIFMFFSIATFCAAPAHGGVPVVDKPALLQRAEQFIRVIRHYITEVTFWMEKINMLVRQYTTLQGILEKAESTLKLRREDIANFLRVVDLIREAQAIWRDAWDRWYRGVTILKDWHRRARDGIFNPEQDIRDLKDYVLNTMGDRARVRLAVSKARDPELRRLEEEILRVRLRIAELESKKKQLEQRHNAECKPSASSGNQQDKTTACIALENQMESTSSRLDALRREERELVDKYQSKMKALAEAYEEIWASGYEMVGVIDAWNVWNEEKNRLMNCLMLEPERAEECRYERR